MELNLILDGGAGTLNDAMWLENSSSPIYQQLSPNEENGSTAQQASLPVGYHSPPMIGWETKNHSPTYSPDQDVMLRSSSSSPQDFPTTTLLQNSRNRTRQHCLKRRTNEDLQQADENERKIIKRDGSNSNDSGQGWSAQVEDLADHLVADFDGSLSALAASDLATTVASYNMSEALLALPSLTVFKQEAPSPENHHSNPSLNHVSQRAINAPPGNGPSVVGVAEADSNNNNNGQTTSLHQLLYSSGDDYSTASSTGNQVSSSQQGNECGEDCRFQYVLAAATSIATKVNEETLTYLNQGQSYEIKLKKLGDLSTYRRKILKSTIRICFHERRLQYTEREQMLAWQRMRPGERLLEVDVPLSYGAIDVCQPSPSSNLVEFMWDPTKEVGIYIKVNCISTEFTPKKHGGEKGVPFRVQVETRIAGGPRLHAASCQIKVFKLKGADRKHKQDRDKVHRRPPHEQDKYQPSYDCTVLSDIPLNCLSPPSPIPQTVGSPFAPDDTVTPQNRGPITGSTSPGVAPHPLSISASRVLPLVSSADPTKESSSPPSSVPSPVAILPDQPCTDVNVMTISTGALSPDASASQMSSWLRAGRFHAFESTFASFSAADILRLSRDDLIQICGLADGIRLFNALHSRGSTPKLTLYFSTDNSGSLWRAVYLDTLTSNGLAKKIHSALGVLGSPQELLHSLVLYGPQGIHILVTDELVGNMRDESMYIIEIIKDTNGERYKILLKPSSRG